MRFVLAAVCALALEPLAAASTRTLSSERPLTSPTAAPSQEVFHADIASNGSMALALWVDYRSTFPDVFFTRIDASGNVLYPIGIALTSSSLYEDNPVRVVSRGTGFLAGWTSRSVTSNDPMGVWLAAIDGDGHASSTRVAPGRLLDLATNGDTTAVIARVPLNFTDYLFDVYATLLDANFSVIRRTKVASNVYPRIVSSSIGFLLAWFDGSGPPPRVVAVRLDPTGAAIDSQPFPLVSVTRYPPIAVAASGADAYVAIAEDSSHAAEIAHVGAGGGVTLTSIEAADSITSLSVAADGSFTVAAKKTNMPVLRSIGANGATTARTQVATVGDSIGLFAVVGHRPYAVVMETGRLLGRFAADP